MCKRAVSFLSKVEVHEDDSIKPLPTCMWIEEELMNPVLYSTHGEICTEEIGYSFLSFHNFFGCGRASRTRSVMMSRLAKKLKLKGEKEKDKDSDGDLERNKKDRRSHKRMRKKSSSINNLADLDKYVQVSSDHHLLYATNTRPCGWTHL